MNKLFEEQLRRLGREYAQTSSKSAASILRARSESSATHFDVFLTHAKLDPELLLGVLRLLETAGLRVHVDWRSGLGVTQSSPTTSDYRNLIRRMAHSDTLIYAFDRSATQPQRQPWELAHFDGSKQRVATIPIFRTLNSVGSDQGFLPLYPQVEFAKDGLKIVGAGTAKKFTSWKNNPSSR